MFSLCFQLVVSVFGLTLWSLINSKLNFFCGRWAMDPISFIYMERSSFLRSICYIFFSDVFLTSLSEDRSWIWVGLVLGLLFYSMSLYACFITVALGYNLRSEIVIFLVLLYLLILVLAIKGLLCLQLNFSILFLVF